MEWSGTAGMYVVTLGSPSSCSPGHAAGLPTLRAGVGALSRMLLGVREASVLAVSTDLDGDPQLLRALDRVIQLPPPDVGWDF